MVLFGAFMSALAAVALLLSLQYNLQALRSTRVGIQADQLAESGIEEAIGYLRNNSGKPPEITTQWIYVPTATVTQLVAAPATSISGTADIYYREVAGSYFTADQVFYGFMMTDNQSDTDYDIYGFGLVRTGEICGVGQWHKKILKSTTGVSVNFFVQESQAAGFLTVDK